MTAGTTQTQISGTRKRILVICPFPEGIAPAQRLKYEQYFNHWRNHGYDVDISNFMDMDLFRVVWQKGHMGAKISGALKGYFRRIRDLFRIPGYDIVYLFIWATPLGPITFEWLTRKLAKRLVYDIDDNLLVGQALPSQYNPNKFVSFFKNPNKARVLIRTADHVITSSTFLNDDCLKINEKHACTYITSSVDTDHFVPRKHRPDLPDIVIGWTGTFSSKPFLDMLHGMFLKLREKRAFEFRIVGNFDYEMPGVNLNVVHFRKDTEIEDLCAFDIGIYPLPENDFVTGKSGMKAIVYMAMGLPIVASPVGTTPLIIEQGRNGLLARNDDEWIDALVRLIDDATLRKSLGDAAREVAESNFSVRAVSGKYLDILDGVAGVTRNPS